MSDLKASIAVHYHERTKYDPETIRAKSKSLNWSQQPVPFKDYKIGVSFDLKPYLNNPPPDPTAEWWQRLSKLLFCSYGLTGMIPTDAEPHYVRAAPSAGGLYPAEIYLISRGTPFLPAGLYNYQAKTHSLLQFWESDVWTSLQSACFWNPVLEGTQLAIILSAVFYRSFWRYEDRAYRRIFLDTGHLLGNLELASSLNDFRPHLIGGFADEAVNQLLYLDSQQEGTIAVMPLADVREVNQNLPLTQTALPSSTQREYPDLDDGALLDYFHQTTQILLNPTAKVNWKLSPAEEQDKYNFPFCLKMSTVSEAIAWGDQLIDLEQTILRRRSTRAYNGAALTLDELKALLDFTYQPQHYVEQDLDGSPDYFDLSLVETFIAVSSVTGLEEGCYYYAPKAQELRQIRFKNFRRELHYLCLGQDLGRDASAVLFHTADLKAAIKRYGDRAYRYLHMDAGHLGQRLNLAAIHLGLGVSGIAGFFDDQVNEVLGIPADEAVLYITTLGRPRRP
ncbi:SagB/ThcOx family dehydrogenase [Phormidesmis priestleyi ULC007]|uniref:SagB/ThcOx family dehydrogenase n=1 Tax=Phormidesmis priestleyi ULC007 TaxID=1920490 RepID=A0A2T1D721_9CYAN|nr:SagB/ThcOx family dehydrogenase [Phormidesmis priestleyi]PSB16246.1 SagB/ThcOx family dehydrogenase [Phormidesmis priestleyi ULC007]PZO46874.1 MAG: SagB/ThcOx family dehydrogenase [Phormidesmis priestleyi]